MVRVKQLFLVLIGCVLSVLANPLVLAASDDFLALAPNYQAADKLVASREAEETSARAAERETAEEVARTAANVQVAQATKLDLARNTARNAASVATSNYTVTRTLSTAQEYAAVSANPSYSDIYRFGSLVFAHNTANLFGPLANLTAGQVVNLTENGATRAYRVASMQVYDYGEYRDANLNGGQAMNVLNHDPYFINKLVGGALGHSAALMTCAGTPLPGGNATQRLVVFLDLI